MHLDVDASGKGLHRALVERGHDVRRILDDWMPRDADDERQLLSAAAHGRCIPTFRVRDFVALANRYPRHNGIILAAQATWTLPGLIAALDRLLSTTEAGEWMGRVRWLNDWRLGIGE